MTVEIVLGRVSVEVTDEQAKEIAILLLRYRLQKLNVSQIKAISKLVDELYP